MSKKILDIIVKEKRQKQTNPSRLPPKNITSRQGKGFFHFLFSVLLAGVVFIVLFFAFRFFSYATVKIFQKHENLAVNFQIKNFPFEIIRLEYEDVLSSEATGFSQNGQKAGGTVVIYNNTSSSQKLKTETRLEASGGKIFKTQKAITIPANGSIEANVLAEKTGPEYNIGFVDFTIVGFKGTVKYDKIYGRAKIEIRGGSNSGLAIVAENDIKNAKDEIERKIKNYLTSNLIGQRPMGYVLHKNSIKIDYIIDPLTPRVGESVSAEKRFIFKEKGVATGILMNENNLTEEILKNYNKENEKDNIIIANINDLDFALISQGANNKEATFNLSGKADLVWKLNTNSLISDLSSAKGRSYEDIFEKYPAINKAEIIFKPAWWKFLPTRQSHIKVEIND